MERMTHTFPFQQLYNHEFTQNLHMFFSSSFDHKFHQRRSWSWGNSISFDRTTSVRNMAATKVILALSCLLPAVFAGDIEKETPVFLCGRQLANARVIVCYGVEALEKRSDNLLTYLAKRDSEDNWIEDWPWTGKQGSLSAGWGRYKRDGLADLCCLKPCTTDVILNYC